MTCREVLEFLADYLNRELNEESRRAFELHMLRCPSCINYLNSYQQTIAMGRAMADEDLEATMPEELLHAVLASCGSAV